MGEKVVKLHEQLSFHLITTAGNQAISTPGTEGESLRRPPEAHLPGRETELQATPAPIRTHDPTQVRSGSHDPEKGPLDWHLQPSHDVSISHSRVAYADSEDDGDGNGPKEHAIWILVGHFTSDKTSFALTYTKPTDLPLRLVASSCSANSTLHPSHRHATSAAPSTVLLLEEKACLRTLSSIAFAATGPSARAHILFLRHK